MRRQFRKQWQIGSYLSLSVHLAGGWRRCSGAWSQGATSSRCRRCHSGEGCQLEILPKIESAGEGSTSDITLRKRLVHMLGVVHELPIDAGSMTQLGWQKDTVLELLIRLFCMRVADAVRQGMPRQYVAHDEDLPALRGRLDVTRQFSRHAVAPQRLACRFDDLSADIALNQVMRAAISRLLGLSQAPDNLRALRELSLAYADVAEVPINALPWERITLDRSNQRWRDLLSFARLFLSDRHQQTSAAGSTATRFCSK